VFRLSFAVAVDAPDVLGVVAAFGVPTDAVVGATSAPALARAEVDAAAGCELEVGELESLPPQALSKSSAGTAKIAAVVVSRLWLKVTS
jgi:hypothetical protein